VGLQETFQVTTALQVAGFSPFVKPARPAPQGKKHRAIGGLATLVSAQLSSLYSVTVVDDFDLEGFENLCLKFESRGDAKPGLPDSFTMINCYVVAHPAAFDFSGLFFALEAFILSSGGPVVLLGDLNAHWKLSDIARYPSARDRDLREFVMRMEDAGFAWCPSSLGDLRGPTYISPQSSSVIDYFFMRGVPISGYAWEDLFVYGHRGLQLSLDWPSSSSSVLRERPSHRKHFRVPPPPTFFPRLQSNLLLHSHVDFIRAGISQVFALFVLCLGELFQVSKGPVSSSHSEPWHRYLSEVELGHLRRLEKEVFDLVAGAQIEEVPLGLNEQNKELRQLQRSLHVQAIWRLLEEVCGSYDDPTRLWGFVRKFRVRQDQGVLPIDVLVSHFSAVFN
jgi:hypothetical protein